MTRFPTPAHLSSWARFAPGVSESAGRTKGNAGTGTGTRYLVRVVGEAAVSAGRTDTFLGERYRPSPAAAARSGRSSRSAARFSSSSGCCSDIDAQFVDLGADYYADRTNPERRARHHIRELQTLGYTVTLNPAA